jgi:hypothetical protein
VSSTAMIMRFRLRKPQVCSLGKGENHAAPGPAAAYGLVLLMAPIAYDIL